ncbi:MAG: U32 family peptidase [Eubacteriales bacterium]|nr:U32 family peptidase [Eubacteriales bacterium]
MNKPEILAPAGGMDSLTAAVRSGADAVYLGATCFSARSSAQNFSEDELKSAVDYCHLHGAKAYLTLNTLIFDSEMNSALNLAFTAYNTGIDALIIQDLGLADILRKELPDLPLHASTQMSVHSPEGAKFLRDLGFKRVVLSREMTLEEIKAVKDACPIELEIFVHGALCMSVSGQCYFSAMLGGRSGNRGKCAQPCRLPFKLAGGSDYALSLKDNSLVDHLDKLAEIGVHSLKIEGRMKRPEYVASTVKACREKLDFGFITDGTKKALEGVFSRTGFTDGYLTGHRGYDMFGYRRKEDVVSATDKLLCEIENSYRKELSHIPVDLTFTAKLSEKPTLVITCGEHKIALQSETLTEKALNRPLSREKIREQLSKTGGTPYLVNSITIDTDRDISLPVSVLNELRRNALSRLSTERCKTHRTEKKPPEYTVGKAYTPEKSLSKRARFNDSDIPDCFKDFELCFVPLFTKEQELKRLVDEGFSLGVEIPRGLFSREEKVKNALKTAKELGITHALVGNLGGINPAKDLGFTLHGDFGLNILNTAAIDFLEETGFADTTLSLEISEPQAKKLSGKLPRGLVTYGYLPLMLTRNCPGNTRNEGCKSCNRRKILQDRKGMSFIFTCDGNCTEILNSAVLFLGDKLETLSFADFHMLRFSVENSVEKVENSRKYSSEHLISGSFTRGLLTRGVK